MEPNSFMVPSYVVVDVWWKLDRSWEPPIIGWLALLTDSEVTTPAILAQ